MSDFKLDYNVKQQKWTIHYGPSLLPIASGGGWAMKFGERLFNALESGQLNFEEMNQQEWPDNYPK